ncbi:hydrogenase expression/formation protein HypE [Planifilum fulgidum]|uniref:Hydrogenase expression/formation protein HypE n=1 Tax=Planifilum fulgidum TaxID=201973 RepID=A0A1I2Q1P5_9BACL|nr:hydrogenase expression/formation protein HypE [Planifilum fulgidum]SFG22282.1 hydrogenase expression/formation protein HypE [Planifilum fulgidum]
MKGKISLAHGDGGELAHQLVREVFVEAFGHEEQARWDAALLPLEGGDVAISTDSFVIKPLFFPGGDIGKLAVSGTVNDIAVSGAEPRFLTAGFILEEGFPVEDLRRIARSMAEEAKRAGVRIVAGDTKVVERGGADGLFVHTTGIGRLRPDRRLHPEQIREGDAVIISGTIGDHGIAVLAARGEMGLSPGLFSDCASLSGMISELLSSVRGVRIMRDPTRGGLATALVEICEDFRVTVQLDEAALPVRREVRGACDIFGFDPLYLANEGKVVLIVAQEDEEKVVKLLRGHPLGREAAVIGRVTGREQGRLLLRSTLGSTRRLSRMSGMMLPRIC